MKTVNKNFNLDQLKGYLYKYTTLIIIMLYKTADIISKHSVYIKGSKSSKLVLLLLEANISIIF